MSNAIYLLVAIFRFCFWAEYLCDEQNVVMKRLNSVTRVIFLISNIICLMLVKQNEYFNYTVIRSTNTGEELLSVGYILFSLPIIIYLIECICFLLKKSDVPSLGVLWMVYVAVLIISIINDPFVKSEDVLTERDNIIDFREEIVKSTFINDSVDGVDYIIKQQDSAGREIRNVIHTRTYKDDEKVEIYPNQGSSYIEKYVTVETCIGFFGKMHERNTDKITYKIYLTDELYQSK